MWGFSPNFFLWVYYCNLYNKNYFILHNALEYYTFTLNYPNICTNLWMKIYRGEWGLVEQPPESKMQGQWLVRGDLEIWHWPPCFKRPLWHKLFDFQQFLFLRLLLLSIFSIPITNKNNIYHKYSLSSGMYPGTLQSALQTWSYLTFATGRGHCHSHPAGEHPGWWATQPDLSHLVIRPPFGSIRFCLCPTEIIRLLISIG